MHIGDITVEDKEIDAIDASGWDDTFFGDRTALEYTTNSIAYLAEGLNITIDITGQGVHDTCNKLIRIPVDDVDRDSWLLLDNMGNIDYSKIFRFWKLRVKGYVPADESTKDYIVNKFKDCNKKPTCTVNFKKFYCKTVLSGKYTNGICKIES